MKNNATCTVTARCSLCGDVEFAPGTDRDIPRQEAMFWRRHMALVFVVHSRTKHGGGGRLALLRDGTLLSSAAEWASDATQTLRDGEKLCELLGGKP